MLASWPQQLLPFTGCGLPSIAPLRHKVQLFVHSSKNTHNAKCTANLNASMLRRNAEMCIHFLSFHVLIFPTHHPHQKIKSLMCSCPVHGALHHRWKEHMAVRKVSRCSVSVSALFNPRWLHLYSVTKRDFFFFFRWSAPSWDRQNSAECGDSLRGVEALLTQVVEEQWGYRLCLLERDLLPGGGQSDIHCVCIQSVRGHWQKPWLPSFFSF